MIQSPMQDSIRQPRRDNVNININSVRNKFDQVADLMKGKIDVLMTSESKIDDSFSR